MSKLKERKKKREMQGKKQFPEVISQGIGMKWKFKGGLENIYVFILSSVVIKLLCTKEPK